MELAYAVFNFAKEVSEENASMLIKVWDNGDLQKFFKELKQYYAICKHVKPPSSRSDSAELFILCKEYKKI